MNHPEPDFQTDVQPDLQPDLQPELADVPSDLTEETSEGALEVRRNAAVSAVVGIAASVTAIAYLGRAAGTGTLLDWALCVVLAALAVVHLHGFLDSRVPLLVADGLGVRLRFGRTWQGVPWSEVEGVEVARRRGLRDGVLTVRPRDEEALLAALDAAGRRRARWSRRFRGAPLSVPLSLSTRLVSADADPVSALARLVDDRPVVVSDLDLPQRVDSDAEVTAGFSESISEPASAPEAAGTTETTAVVGVDADALDDLDDLDDLGDLGDAGERPVRRRLHDPRPGLARGIGALAARLPRRTLSQRLADPAPEATLAEPAPETEVAFEVAAASETPEPARETTPASRSEVLLDEADTGVDDDSRTRELRRPGSVSLVEDTVVWSDRVSPLGAPKAPPILIDDLATASAAEPAPDPVIGPELAAARSRLGLTVDQLAERTRIRPHVIESLEVDDFAPCGGDFYARGHLRTLARVLGLDAAPLLTAYDERYADAEISPRRVFEAELAGGPHGPIRGTRGGPNWSVLVAAVMALVLVWSVARLLTDGPVAVDDTPALNGSPGLGLSGGGQKLAEPVPVVLTAAGGGAHVVVRDGGGRVAFSGDVAFGDSRELKVSPPVRVQSSDGSLEVTVAGEERGPLGATGEPAQNTFLAP